MNSCDHIFSGVISGFPAIGSSCFSLSSLAGCSAGLATFSKSSNAAEHLQKIFLSQIKWHNLNKLNKIYKFQHELHNLLSNSSFKSFSSDDGTTLSPASWDILIKIFWYKKLKKTNYVKYLHYGLSQLKQIKIYYLTGQAKAATVIKFKHRLSFHMILTYSSRLGNVKHFLDFKNSREWQVLNYS